MGTEFKIVTQSMSIVKLTARLRGDAGTLMMLSNSLAQISSGTDEDPPGPSVPVITLHFGGTVLCVVPQRGAH